MTCRVVTPLAAFKFGLLLHPEDGSHMFLKNVRKLLLNYTVVQPKVRALRSNRCGNLKARLHGASWRAS
jgi:hypothetical protein